MSEASGEHLPRGSHAQTWLVFALVVALPAFTYPLAWFTEHAVRHRYELQLPIPLFYLISVLTVFAWQLWNAGTIELPMIGVDRPLLAVLGVGVISTILSSNLYFSISSLLLLFAHVTLLYAVGLWFDLRRVKPLLVVWLAVATLEALYGIWQRRHGIYPWGTIGNVDWMAAYLGVSMCVSVPLWMDSERRGQQWIWLLPCNIAMLVVFVWCDSLGAWLGLGLAAATCGFRILWARRRMHALIFAGVVLVAGATTGALKFSYIEGLWQVNVRPQIWKGTLHMIRESPLIGTGIGTFTYQFASYRPPEYFDTNVVASAISPETFRHRRQPANLTDHAHNEFLEIAAESGILGLAITLWLFGAVIVRGWRGWRPDNPHRWIMMGAWGAMIALLVHNQFDISLRRPPCQTLFWLLMGLIVRCSDQPATKPDNGLAANAPGVPSALSASPPPSVPASPLARLITVVFFVFLIGLLAKRYAYDTVASNVAYRKALIVRGDGPVDRERAQRAMQFYILSLEHDPYRVEAWYRLAFLCAQFPETDEQAIDYYLQVKELSPAYGDVNSNLAYLFLQRGKKNEAIDYLSRAIKLNPYNMALHRALIQLLLDLKLDRDLKEEILDVLRIYPDDPLANEIWQDRFKQEKMDLAPHKSSRARSRPKAPR